MRQKIMNSERNLRATIEYEEAVFLFALKNLVQLELQTINADLKVVGRISRQAVLLAKEDLARHSNERLSVFFGNNENKEGRTACELPEYWGLLRKVERG